MRQSSLISAIVLSLLFVVSTSAVHAQSLERQKSNTSQVSVAKHADNEQITINFTVVAPVENVLILIRNEKGELVFMENRNRFQGAYTRTISLKEVEGKNFDVQIKNDAEQINRTISMR